VCDSTRQFQETRIVRLSEVTCEIKKRNSENKILPVYSVSREKGLVRSIEFFKKQVYSKKLSNYKIIEHGEMAYNPSRINVGSIAINDKDLGLVSPFFVVVRCATHLNPKYLLCFLRSIEGLNQTKHRTEGSVRNSLTYSNFGRIELRLPTVGDQLQIVSTLDSINALLRKRQKAYDLLDVMIQSIFMVWP
jgi:type I restriction enzyme, S subunit